VGQSGKVTISDECKEFMDSEIEGLVANIVGKPLLFEHDDNKILGQVLAARRIHAGAVEVTASIDDSTEAGKETISQLEREELWGLSLGHEYELDVMNDANRLKIEMCSSADKLQPFASDSFPHRVTKVLKELSVCREPARKGCFIRDLVRASSKHMSSSAPSDTLAPKQDSAPIKGADPLNAHNTDRLSKGVPSIRGIFKCSLKLENSTVKAVQPSEESTNRSPNEPVMSHEVPASQQPEPVANPDPPAEDTPAVPAVQDPEPSAAAQPRDDLGRFATNEAVPSTATDAPPVAEPTQAEPPQPSNAAIQDAAQQDEEVAALIKKFHSQYESMQQQLQAANDARQKAEEQKSQLDTIMKQKQDELDKAEREKEEQRKQILKAQRSKRDEAMSALDKLINGGSSVAAVAKPTGGTQELPEAAEKAPTQIDTASDPDIAANVNQTNILKAAMNKIQELQKKQEQQQSDMNGKKRKSENISAALENFSGLLQNSPYQGMVKASANETASEAATKRQAVTVEAMQKFRQQNPDATWYKYTQAYRSVSKPTAITGTVNASKNWSWTPGEEDNQHNQAQPADLNAQHLHPEFFAYASSLNTGRIIANNDASGLIKGINQQSRYGAPF
jgi:hypothetical protein